MDVSLQRSLGSQAGACGSGARRRRSLGSGPLPRIPRMHLYGHALQPARMCNAQGAHCVRSVGNEAIGAGGGHKLRRSDLHDRPAREWEPLRGVALSRRCHLHRHRSRRQAQPAQVALDRYARAWSDLTRKLCHHRQRSGPVRQLHVVEGRLHVARVRGEADGGAGPDRRECGVAGPVGLTLG